nr:mediator of RNA polymerase II transcription subunit 10B-like [Ipomoea batatas]
MACRPKRKRNREANEIPTRRKQGTSTVPFVRTQDIIKEHALIRVANKMLHHLINDGKNPDEFTRDVLNSCIAKNQITRGKIDAFKGLRKHRLDELEEAFGDEVEAYRMILATSAAVVGNLLRLVPLFDKLVAIRIYVMCGPIPLLLQLSLDPLSTRILQIPLDRIWLMPCHPHPIRRLRSISYTYKFLNPLPA